MVRHFALAGFALVLGATSTLSPLFGWQTAGADGNAEAALLERYQAELVRVRLGSDSAAAELWSTAEALSKLGREDAPKVARFYLNLPADARRSGLAAEERFLAIRERVQSANTLPSGRWALERERIRGELLALIESLTNAPDCTPSARAHALLARLDVARLDRDGSLDEGRRLELLARGRAHAETAQSLFERASQRTPQLEPVWLLAELQRLDGDRLGATQRYRELLALAQTTHKSEFQENALRGLVALARESGDYVRLEELLNEWSTLEDPRESWPLAMEQALWLLSQDEPRSVLTTLWACRPKDHEDLAQWQALLASALRRRGHLPAARRALERMQQEFPGEWELLILTEAFQEAAEQDFARSQELLQDAYPFTQWSARGRVQALALLGEVQLEQGAAQAALGPLQEAIEGAHRWESRRLGPGSVGGEWLGLHAVVLAAQAAAQNGDLVGAAVLLEQNQSRDLQRATALTTDAQALRARFESARGRGAGVLTYGFGSDFALVVYLGPDGEGAFARIPHGRHAWCLALRRLSQAIRQNNQVATESLTRELSAELLPEPIRQRLRQHVGSELMLLMHGPLEQVPVALLDFDLKPIQQRFVVVASPLLGPLDRATTPDWSALLWRFLGSPTESNMPPLPAAEAELVSLANSRTGSVLVIGDALTPQALEKALHSGEALHIATHLIPSSQCEGFGYANHGLLLSKGEVLCSAQIQASNGHSPLVYLGTCSSGTGRWLDGEGTLGVARAFLESGAGNLIVTLWPVEDGAAAAFAGALHAALAAGKPPSQAVECARESLRAQGMPMADWAAFQHLGWD